MYELELKEKMRKIKKKEIKQKQAEEEKRMQIGKSIFNQIMA